MLGAQRLDRAAVDGVGRQERDRLCARRARLLAQRQEILHRLLYDRFEPLLLRIGGIDLDIQMLEHSVEMLVDRGGVEGPGGEAAAVPAATAPLSESFEADSRGDPADERRDRGALEKPPALA